MKRVVSVSLGSKKGDKTATATFLGQPFELTRRSVAGIPAAMELIRELDGQVDAIGLGGIDRYLYAGERRYTIRDGERLAQCARTSPVVDGSGIKNTLERNAVLWLQRQGLVDFPNQKVLLVCAVDRFGMAQALDRLGGPVIYGDLLFSLGLPVPMRSHAQVKRLGALILPVVTRLPFQWLYPTGEQENQAIARHEQYFRWADVIAGDFKYIKRYLPSAESGALAGKTVLTQTLTPTDVEALRERGVSRLVTSTREFDGRTFATNVVEGVIVALAGKRPEEMQPEEYDTWLERLEWTPTVRALGDAGGVREKENGGGSEGVRGRGRCRQHPSRRFSDPR
ncbi:MAG TPA: quinate 5-dehydrogenase [Armatimonadota bacterium]|nr:quinate 5-dehydrogenase [Armatimonadota bacterium]